MDQNMKYRKKGQLAGNAVGNIIALIVGIGVAVLVLIFVGSLGGSTYNLIEDDISDIGNNVVTGDGFTVLNETAVRLDHSFIQQGTLSIYNESATKAVWGLNNFTIDYTAGSVQIAAGGDPLLNNTALQANYTWGGSDIRSSVQNSITSGFEALEQAGDYTPIIVLAVVIALVLSIVLGFTALGNRGLGGSAL